MHFLMKYVFLLWELSNCYVVKLSGDSTEVMYVSGREIVHWL